MIISCSRLRSLCGRVVQVTTCCAVVAFAWFAYGAESISPNRFSALPDDDKCAAIVTALEQRQQLLQNVLAESVTRVHTVKFKNHRTQEVLQDLGRYVCQSQRLGNAYRITVACWKPEDHQQPASRTTAAYDPKTALGHILMLRADTETPQGIIARAAIEEDWNNRYIYCLGGELGKRHEDYTAYLLEHRRQIEIQPPSDDHGLVEITIPEQTRQDSPPLGLRRVWLDPQKKFLIVRARRETEFTDVGGQKAWFLAEFDVQASKQLAGVWLPTHLSELTASSLSSETATVFDTQLTHIDFGHVARKDLDVTFPPGTKIADPKSYWLLTAEGAPEENTSFRRWIWLLAVAIVFVAGIVVGAVVWRRHRATKVASDQTWILECEESDAAGQPADLPRQVSDPSHDCDANDDSDQAGFTLVELLVVMSIISILIGLLLPAVQAAREAARKMQCGNNLHQIGLAVMQHESATQRLPSGGWGWLWTADPDRGNDKNQPGGWIYNILPYLEQQAVHDLGMGTDPFTKQSMAVQMQGTKLPGLNCPSRRAEGRFKHECGVAIVNAMCQTEMDARSDYAANAGDFYVYMEKGPTAYEDQSYQWPDVSKMTGISYLRSEVRMADVRDGTTNTYLVGEKYLSTEHYTDGKSFGDDYSLYQGADHDIYRWVGENPSKPWPPLQDSDADEHSGDLFRMFGSCHAGVWNVAFCDGSVHTISLSIDRETHRRLGNRNDGKVVDSSKF